MVINMCDGKCYCLLQYLRTVHCNFSIEDEITGKTLFRNINHGVPNSLEKGIEYAKKEYGSCVVTDIYFRDNGFVGYLIFKVING